MSNSSSLVTVQSMETIKPQFALLILNSKAAAPAGGGDLDPAPQVQLLDFYKSHVRGRRAEKVEISVEMVRDSMATNDKKDAVVAGGVNAFPSASSGSAVFKSLRLLGKPGSGPHRLRFTATIQVGESVFFGTSRRYLDSSASHFNVSIGKCPQKNPALSARNAPKQIGSCRATANSDEYLDDTDADKYKHNCVRCPPGGYCDKTTTLSTLRRSPAGGGYQKTRCGTMPNKCLPVA